MQLGKSQEGPSNTGKPRSLMPTKGQGTGEKPQKEVGQLLGEKTRENQSVPSLLPRKWEEMES